jgi:hypothetical protein
VSATKCSLQNGLLDTKLMHPFSSPVACSVQTITNALQVRITVLILFDRDVCMFFHSISLSSNSNSGAGWAVVGFVIQYDTTIAFTRPSC